MLILPALTTVYLARFRTLLRAWTTYIAVPAGTKCNLPVKNLPAAPSEEPFGYI